MSVISEEVKWSADQMVEVGLKEPDDFLKVRETLTIMSYTAQTRKILYCAF